MKLVPIFIVARNFETNFSHNNCHNMARIIVYVGLISVGSDVLNRLWARRLGRVITTHDTGNRNITRAKK